MGSAQSNLKEISAEETELEKLKKENESLTEILKMLQMERENDTRLHKKEAEMLEDLVDCPICSFPYSKEECLPMVGACGHTMCNRCVQTIQNVTDYSDCPICREDDSFSQPRRNFLAYDLLDRGNLLAKEKHTILILEGFKDGSGKALALSDDRSKWIEIPIDLPDIKLSGVVYLNGEIYIVGGYCHPKRLYKLDKNQRWIQLADMNEERKQIGKSCLAWKGCIWVFGGTNSKSECLKSVERYDPKEDEWTLMPDMHFARPAPIAVSSENTVIISGADESGLINLVEFMNPADNSWKELIFIPALSNYSQVLCKENLIIMGGYHGEVRREVWQMDPNAKWTPLPPMSWPSCYHGGIILDDEIYAIGGLQKGFEGLNRVEIFDGIKWRDGPPLPRPLSSLSPIIVPNFFVDRLHYTSW